MRDARSIAGEADRLDDDDALARAAAADLMAFGSIYERHRTAVYRYLRARTSSDDEAAELAAVTFERAMGAIGRFRASGGALASWLIRIARNAHLDEARRTSRSRPGTERGSGSQVAGHEDDVILRTLVEALPAGHRDALQLRFAAGLTAREIGSVLGISEAAAQKQVERGLHALREALDDHR